MNPPRDPQSSDPAVYAARLERVRDRLRHEGLDYCFVGPSSDLRYLTGIPMHPSERLALLVVPGTGPAHLVVPAFETSGLPPLPESIRVVSWDETDDPAHLVARLIHPPGQTNGVVCTAAVGDQLWAGFLLRLQAALPRVTFSAAEQILPPLRLIKDAAEVAALAEAARRADDAFTAIRALPFAGQTERQVAEAIAGLLRRRGLNPDWGPIVGSGPNGANPHHHASDRVIAQGDLVVLDYGGELDGYRADMTRTVAVGAPPAGEAARVYDLVYQGQERGVQAARPGLAAAAPDAVVRDFFAAAGYGAFFTHRLGHGIGLDDHEPPYIVAGNALPLRHGMAFSVEPGLYLPGRFGVRIEDIVVLGESGAERLNHAPRELVVVE